MSVQGEEEKLKNYVYYILRSTMHAFGMTQHFSTQICVQHHHSVLMQEVVDGLGGEVDVVDGCVERLTFTQETGVCVLLQTFK